MYNFVSQFLRLALSKTIQQPSGIMINPLLDDKILDWSKLKQIADEIFKCRSPARWLSDERVGLMTWWLRVRSPVEATLLSGVFSPLTSAEACEKSSRWLWKEKLC